MRDSTGLGHERCEDNAIGIPDLPWLKRPIGRDDFITSRENRDMWPRMNENPGMTQRGQDSKMRWPEYRSRLQDKAS